MSREIKFKVWDKLLNKHCPYNPFLRFNDETLKFCQYTGCNDKNGVEIYEEDLIKVADRDFMGILIVKWKPDTANYCARINNDDHSYHVHFFEMNNIEVVGNVYENPEILVR